MDQKILESLTMRAPTRKLILVLACASLIVAGGASAAQDSKRECKKSAMAAWKPIPKLRYSCGANKEWDEAMLKRPQRLRAVKLLQTQLESLNSAAWWQISTDDLNVCDFYRKPGRLNAEQQERYDTSYITQLYGNDRIRMLVLPDPCYQTEYSGSNVFILVHKGANVFATEAIDGFFTRADNAVNMNFGKLDQEEIIEVSTGSGGLHPQLTNYYFTLNPKTNRALPKNIFIGEDGKPTNQITSALLMSDPEEFGLPAGAEALKIIENNRLVDSFSIYEEVFDDTAKIDDNGRKLNRRVLKWNGKIFK
jgi:hypothetical protein